MTTPAPQDLVTAFHTAQFALQDAQTIFFTTHERTDGDDLGTVLALYHALKKSGKKVLVGVKGGVPSQLKFLPGYTEVVNDFPPTFIPDTIVISGCSNLERTGMVQLGQTKATIINFDHHPDNQQYGDINVVDPAASSVAELTYNFFKSVGWPITSEIATCLLTGIITDTGSFLHSNTKPSTLKAASELMRKGARTTLVAKHTFKGKNAAALRAWGKALQNAWLDTDKKMICSIITSEDLEELGNPPLAVFEGIVETLNKVPEATFALFLKQDGITIKGSLRSDPEKSGGGVDVGSLAQAFGGGGHRFAAGFVFPGKLKRTQNNTWLIEPAPEDDLTLIPE